MHSQSLDSDFELLVTKAVGWLNNLIIELLIVTLSGYRLFLDKRLSVFRYSKLWSNFGAVTSLRSYAPSLRACHCVRPLLLSFYHRLAFAPSLYGVPSSSWSILGVGQNEYIQRALEPPHENQSVTCHWWPRAINFQRRIEYSSSKLLLRMGILMRLS